MLAVPLSNDFVFFVLFSLLSCMLSVPDPADLLLLLCCCLPSAKQLIYHKNKKFKTVFFFNLFATDSAALSVASPARNCKIVLMPRSYSTRDVYKELYCNSGILGPAGCAKRLK